VFAERARQTPDAVALTFEGGDVSYRELDRRANQLAHHLRRQGVGPETLVALLVERSPDAIVGILGVLKAGGAYLPLDPQHPRERLRFLLDDAQTPVLVTEQSLQHLAPAGSMRVVRLDADRDAIAAESVAPPVNTATPDNLAYVIYTSGSTGQPKGALIRHRGVVNFALACARTIGMNEQDRMLQFFTLGFDASVTEIFMTLLSGATLCMARREDTLATSDLLRFLRDQAVSVVLFPPSLLKLTPAAALPDLRIVISAGEACTREIVAQWAPGRRFFNAYGPTETTVGPTIYSVDAEAGVGDGVPIGKPIANMTVYVLDERRQPVPIGVPGELYIAGVGLALGYLNRPQLTAERFVELQLADCGLRGSQFPPIRAYRTGDQVRFLPDGNLEYLGRLDHQVKIRGFRIELGEIEAQLEQHPAIRQAAVLAREDQPGEKRLVAYVAADAGAAPAFEELRAFLQRKLPDYMLPAALVRLDALPVTTNGKVDRKALPAPDGVRPQLRRAFVAPRDLMESQLAQLWEDVLDVRPIGVTDNFHELGGHSLLAVRIVGQIAQRAGIQLPLLTLFQHPTIEGLAGALRRMQHELPDATIVRLNAQPADSAATENLPLFLVHPSGGSVHWYLKLADALGRDQPVYGIQARGLNGDAELHTRIEDMAADYIAALRAVQPQGPYQLGSWSMGVIFVYEMARQLAEQGEPVALLAMLDQGPDVPGVRPDAGAEYLMQVFGKHLPLERELLAPLGDDEQIRYVLDLARRTGWVHPDMTDEQFRHFVTVLRTHTQAWWDYAPKPYAGRVTLVRAAEQTADPAPPADWGWSRLALGGVEIHEVPGDHIAMMDDPHVRALADCLRASIRRVQPRSALAAQAADQ
jgi:amino acid adenylation domain-containing protein